MLLRSQVGWWQPFFWILQMALCGHQAKSKGIPIFTFDSSPLVLLGLDYTWCSCAMNLGWCCQALTLVQLFEPRSWGFKSHGYPSNPVYEFSGIHHHMAIYKLYLQEILIIFLNRFLQLQLTETKQQEGQVNAGFTWIVQVVPLLIVGWITLAG